jgi:hypothetical protein
MRAQVRAEFHADTRSTMAPRSRKNFPGLPPSTARPRVPCMGIAAPMLQSEPVGAYPTKHQHRPCRSASVHGAVERQRQCICGQPWADCKCGRQLGLFTVVNIWSCGGARTTAIPAILSGIPPSTAHTSGYEVAGRSDAASSYPVHFFLSGPGGRQACFHGLYAQAVAYYLR